MIWGNLGRLARPRQPHINGMHELLAFVQKLKAFTGTADVEYVLLSKIRLATRLFMKPEMSVSDVALASGFNNLSPGLQKERIDDAPGLQAFRRQDRHDEYCSMTDRD